MASLHLIRPLNLLGFFAAAVSMLGIMQTAFAVPAPKFAPHRHTPFVLIEKKKAQPAPRPKANPDKNPKTESGIKGEALKDDHSRNHNLTRRKK